MTSLRSTHSPAWSWWKSMWSLWKRGRRLSRTTPNSWGKPWIFLFFGSLFSRGPSASERSRVSVFVCVRLRFACLKRLFMKCLCGLMTTLGQNQACLWNTGLILQLQCALSSPPSLLSASMLHPLCSPPPSPPRPGCRLHIWCSAELCWRGEEVGADWHMTYRMWSRGRVKGGRAAIFWCSYRAYVFNLAVWSKRKFETKAAFLTPSQPPSPLQRF